MPYTEAATISYCNNRIVLNFQCSEGVGGCFLSGVFGLVNGGERNTGGVQTLRVTCALGQQDSGQHGSIEELCIPQVPGMHNFKPGKQGTAHRLSRFRGHEAVGRDYAGYPAICQDL